MVHIGCRQFRLAGSRLSPVDFRQVHREFEEGWDDEQA
jgi:hypothetical protein